MISDRAARWKQSVWAPVWSSIRGHPLRLSAGLLFESVCVCVCVCLEPDQATGSEVKFKPQTDDPARLADPRGHSAEGRGAEGVGGGQAERTSVVIMMLKYMVCSVGCWQTDLTVKYF